MGVWALWPEATAGSHTWEAQCQSQGNNQGRSVSCWRGYHCPLSTANSGFGDAPWLQMYFAALVLPRAVGLVTVPKGPGEALKGPSPPVAFATMQISRTTALAPPP